MEDGAGATARERTGRRPTSPGRGPYGDACVLTVRGAARLPKLTYLPQTITGKLTVCDACSLSPAVDAAAQ